MALTVNTNVASLNAQRNLGTSSRHVLNKSLQRLSSGLRINSAKDDAAGLAISNRMTSQIRGLRSSGSKCQRRYLPGPDRRRRHAGGPPTTCNVCVSWPFSLPMTPTRPRTERPIQRRGHPAPSGGNRTYCRRPPLLTARCCWTAVLAPLDLPGGIRRADETISC